MEALARRLQGIVWGTFPVSYKLIIHSMLDEKMEKSKKYTWHLLHGIQKNVFFIKLLPFLTMIFVEAQLRALRKSPVGALRRSDRTCSIFTQKRLLLGLRYSWKERAWWANFIKVKVKLSTGDRIGEKKYKKNHKTLTNKHFILKIVSRLTTLCLNKTWYFGWGTPSFTIDSYLICSRHWEKKYIIRARSLVEISESAYRVYRL